jgi:hypothetical protein
MLDYVFEKYRGFKGFIRDTVDKVHEINQKYSKPRVKMDRWVEISLLLLRLYLLCLVLMLVYKFYTMVKGPG